MRPQLSPGEQLRLAAGVLGITLFVSAALALHFVPRRLEVPVLMAAASFLALGGALSGSEP